MCSLSEPGETEEPMTMCQRRYLHRSRLAPLAVAAVICVAPDLSALLWLPHNLNTLVTVSDAIVLAENVGSTRAVTDSRGRNIRLTRYRIQKVYRGPLLPGQVIELRDPYSRYSRDPMLVFDKETILFLTKKDDWALRSVPASDRPEFSITHSGLRLLSRKKVYTFHQLNPGPASPAPLMREHSFRQGTGQVTLDEFEKDIREAIRRVETVRYARSVTDRRKRRDLLLGVLGQYEVEATRRRSDVHYVDGSDAFLQEIVNTFVEAGDIEGALEVFHIWRWSRVKLETKTALEAAANTKVEPRLRAAAIRAIEWRDIRRDIRRDGTRAALERLQLDQHDTVRKAAAERLGLSGEAVK